MQMAIGRFLGKEIMVVCKNKKQQSIKTSEKKRISTYVLMVYIF